MKKFTKTVLAIALFGFGPTGFNSVKAQQKGEPFEGIDQSWQNGSDRRDSSVFKEMKYFTPSILMDINYTNSFNNPNDTNKPM